VISTTVADRVLVLGGGDCVAVREVLRHRSVRHVTLVELDPAVTAMASEVPELRALNEGACEDPRVEVVNADAFRWVRSRSRSGAEPFDAVIADFPDPDTVALGRLYSVELYTMLRGLLEPDGSLVVQCGSPSFAPEAFWTCESTLQAAGWSVTPYHIDVPSFGDWGFQFAQPAPAGDVHAVGEVPDPGRGMGGLQQSLGEQRGIAQLQQFRRLVGIDQPAGAQARLLPWPFWFFRESSGSRTEIQTLSIGLWTDAAARRL